MGEMLTGTCPNCGKTLYVLPSGKMNIYCDQKCRLAYGEKKREARLEQRQKEKARSAALCVTPIPEAQCRKCIYSFRFAKSYGCGYFDITGHTRHSLHPEGMPKECREFAPRRRARKK